MTYHETETAGRIRGLINAAQICPSRRRVLLWFKRVLLRAAWQRIQLERRSRGCLDAGQ